MLEHLGPSLFFLDYHSVFNHKDNLRNAIKSARYIYVIINKLQGIIMEKNLLISLT